MNQASVISELQYRFSNGNILTRLILVNAAVFLVLALFHLITFLVGANGLYLAVLSKLQITASLKTLVYQPWSVLTYMFVHTGLLHILFNMLWLYWFGEIWMLYRGQRSILPLYLTGGLAGALLYIAAYNLIPVFAAQVYSSYMMGASAGVFAIVFAAATIHPNHEINLLIFGPVKIKYVAFISLLLDVVSIPYGNAGGYLAHAGGATLGFAYVKLLQSGTDVFSLRSYRPKMKVSRNENFRPSKFDQHSSEEQAKLDSILDKINRSGYDSLKKEEKDFLFKYSNK